MKKMSFIVLLILSAVCFGTRQKYDYVSTGLIAHYKMNENAASTAVEDSSGNDHDGLARQDTVFLQNNNRAFVKSYGVLIDDLEDVSDWNIYGTGASAENDATQFKQGTQSIKVNATGGNQAILQKSVSLDVSTGNGFSFWFYVHNMDTLSNYPLVFAISSVSNFAKAFQKTIYKTNIFSGWNHVTIAKSDFSVTSDESWDNTMIGARLYVFPATGEDSSVSFDDLRFGIYAEPKVMITFDDCIISQFTKAYPVLAANGQRGVLFPHTGVVGDYWRMTLEDLETLRDAGWDVCNHTVNHLDLTAVSQEVMEAEIDGAHDWLVANGFGETAKFFAYPFARYNDAVITKLKERHVLARPGSYYPIFPHFEISNYHDLQFKLICLSCVYDLPVADVEDAIDRAIEGCNLLILLFHDIYDGEPVQGQYKTEDLEAISDYLKTKQDAELLEVITLTDYYNELVDRPNKINGSFDFNGSFDYIEIADHADFTPALTPFSISSWVYMHRAGGFCIASKGVYNTDGEWQFRVYPYPGDALLYFMLYDENVVDCYIGRYYSVDLTGYENQWIHLVATYDGGTSCSGIKIYLNGTRVDDVDKKNGTFVSVQPSGHPVWIGRYETSYANGLIDDVVFFNEELTVAQIEQIYNARCGIELLGTSSADFNCDGTVYFDDLEVLDSQWLQPPGILSADIAPELGDGIVNFLDFAVLAHDWLQTITP
ncbi:MAG TPA: polysaccharide deacetylase family protein [Planctomycetes bacterium]|nr:polysaccharide deacetylase family protein [Planctomycetota bacterium]